MPRIIRIAIVLILIAMTTYHYETGNWLLFLGDIVVSLIIVINWTWPFILASLRARKQR